MGKKKKFFFSEISLGTLLYKGKYLFDNIAACINIFVFFLPEATGKKIHKVISPMEMFSIILLSTVQFFILTY